MASFAIPDTPKPYDFYGGLVDKFSQGYEIGKGIREAKGRYDYGQAMANAPEAGQGIPEDTQQTDMLQEQTADFADETGALPETEVAAQKSTQKPKRLTTKDWSDWRRSMMDSAARSGDPELVKEASTYVTDYQHNGFLQNMDMANQYLQVGDFDSAAKYLEDANEFMPNRTSVQFSTVGDQLMGQFYDEETGNPANMIAFNKDNLPKFVENFRDPRRFAQWNWEGKYKDAAQAIAESRNAREQARADYEISQRGTTEKREAEMHKAKLGTEQARARSAEARAKYEEQRGPGGRSPEMYANEKEQRIKDARAEVNNLWDQVMMAGGMKALQKDDPELAAAYQQRMNEAQQNLERIMALKVGGRSEAAIREAIAAPAPPMPENIPEGSQYADGLWYTPDNEIYDEQGELVDTWTR